MGLDRVCQSICLITPAHVAANPRLLKEADALQAAGFKVHVVAARYFPPLDERDREIFKAATWAYTQVDLTVGLKMLWAKIRRKLAWQALQRGFTVTPKRASQAHHASIDLLIDAAIKVSADYYIGHNLPGLVAAAESAKRTGGRYGFDAEDFHSAETNLVEQDPLAHAVVTILEKHYLPGCTHLTAASPLIAAAYQQTYALSQTPTTILNVFPRQQAPDSPHPGSQLGSPIKMYWFSQTIGPGRGLEALLEVLAKITTPFELHLRGLPASGYRQQLEALAVQLGCPNTLHWLPFGPSHEMVRMTASYDLGLSLEQRLPRNRDLCLTNKIFTYLLAGVPVAMTPTAAQQKIVSEFGAAGFLLDLGVPLKAAAELEQWMLSESTRRTAREHAWKIGHESYQWESVMSEFLALFDSNGHQSSKI